MFCAKSVPKGRQREGCGGALGPKEAAGVGETGNHILPVVKMAMERGEQMQTL